MLKDIEEEKIDCIITKDLSRFGRDHIDTGYYLERYLPTNNVRYIAIGDNVDTLKSDGLQFLTFKLSFNDYYAQDISNKIKSVKQRKIEKGEYQAGIPPYGYKNDMECYSKILDKIEYLTKTAKMNFSKKEEQIMFVASQLSEYISFYNKYSELNSEEFKQKSSLKGAFLEKETVCIGYAMAFERCMSALGVNCKIVQGEGNFGAKSKVSPLDANHAWNEVQINGKWYNIDVTWLSSYKNNVDLKEEKIDRITENSIIESYVLSSDDQFIDHYKLEDNEVSCKEPLKGRFEIFEHVKIYKNVLEEYDNGKRSNILQVKLSSNPTGTNNHADRNHEENRKQPNELDETIDL